MIRHTKFEDIKTPEASEEEIIVHNLEDGKVDNLYQESALTYFITKIYLIFKYTVFSIRIFLIKLRTKFAKHYWFLSKNRNFYNPILEATVYKYSSFWSIARYGRYFGAFNNKEDAMAEAFLIWLNDKKIAKITNELENELKRVKHKLSSSYNQFIILKGKKLLSHEAKEEQVQENLRADFFYLAQTYTNCYKCKKSTLINAIILPEGFEEVDEYAIEDLQQKEIFIEKNIPFRRQNYLSIISHITYISSEALKEIDNYTSKALFQEQYSMTTGYSYYRSICSYCGAAQCDNYIISEFDSPFYPVNVDKFKKIQFYKILKKIQVRAGSNSIGYAPGNMIALRNIQKNSIPN